VISLITNYVRCVTEGLKPYDPLDLAKRTEEIVISGNKRKYLRTGGSEFPEFYLDGAYGGVITGMSIGCNIRCIFCFAPETRDFPEKFGIFYSPEEVYRDFIKIDANQRSEYDKAIQKCKDPEKAKEAKDILKELKYKVRIGWCEPTIGREHLLGILQLVEENPHFSELMLETNGTILGSDKGYVEQLSRFKKIHCRVSFKAGTPEAFEQRTGAIRDAFYLPLKALEYLMDYGVGCHASAMIYPLMTEAEKENLVRELSEIGIKRIEEEGVRLDPIVAFRLSQAQGERFWNEEELIKFGVKTLSQMKRLRKASLEYSKFYDTHFQ
jgi:uncharacterized Fe-S cluster-containing radical SAM superfamily protein